MSLETSLEKFVTKGVTIKAAAREALDELDELLNELQSVRDEIDAALCDWEEGEDAETRAEGKEQLEQLCNQLFSQLLAAGEAAGMVEKANTP